MFGVLLSAALSYEVDSLIKEDATEKMLVAVLLDENTCDLC